MSTSQFQFSPPLACFLHDSQYFRLPFYLVVALLLLNNISLGQVVLPSRAFPNQALSSNTSPSLNNVKEYVIYSFVEGSSADSENDRIRLHLGMILAPTDVREYGGDYTGVEFWRVMMSDMQRTAFMSANPRVGARSVNYLLKSHVDRR